MAAEFDHNKVLRGTFGKIWLDNERLADVKSFEAKLSADYEDMNVNGDFGTKKRFMGYSIAGTLVCHKTNSRWLKKLAEGFTTGDAPVCKIVATLEDPSVSGTQRVALYDVLFDELTLAQFENKTILEEEMPFTAGSYEVLDVID